jgi:hypothetical protein
MIPKARIALLMGACVFGAIFNVQSNFAQGSLTPPGAPAPTMVTLSQIEPRTPIASVPFTIGSAGSYYLTTNLTGASGQNGITISSGNVTLDLSGFAVQGVSGSGIGIYISGAQVNVTVRNGAVSGWGTAGVESSSATSSNLLFESLNVSSCHVGFEITGAAIVRNCNCEGNAEDGIECGGGIVSGCTANNNGSDGIDGEIITGCTADNNKNNGILGGKVTDCTVETNASVGVFLNPGRVSGCLVQGNKVAGIYVGVAGSDVVGNTLLGNSGNGAIQVQASNNRIEDNCILTTSGVPGIYISSSYINNVVIRNSVTGDSANNYDIGTGNDIGPVGTATNSTSPWANISH